MGIIYIYVSLPDLPEGKLVYKYNFPFGFMVAISPLEFDGVMNQLMARAHRIVYYG